MKEEENGTYPGFKCTTERCTYSNRGHYIHRRDQFDPRNKGQCCNFRVSLLQICDGLLDLGGVARAEEGVIAERKEGERASIHLRPPCKNRWSQRYLSLVRSINRRRVICFYFGQITELLSFFPSTKIIGPLLISSSVADVRTEEKEEENKKKSLIRIHTARPRYRLFCNSSLP